MKQTSAPLTAQVSATGSRSSSSRWHSGRSSQRDRGGGQLADEDRPQVGPVGAPVLQRQDGVQLPAGGVEVAGAGEEPGRDRVGVRRGADPPAHRLGGHVAQLGRVVAGADDLQPLGHAHVAGVAVADRLAEGGRLGAEPFAGVDVAVEQGERGLPGAQQVVVAGLAQPLGDVGVLGEGGPEGRRAVLQLRGGRQQQGLGVPFRVAGPLGQVGDLGGDRGPGGRRCPGVHSVSCWASRQLARVAGSSRRAGDRHRLFGQRPGPRPVGRARSAAAGGPARRSPAPRRASRCRPARAGAVSSTATRSVRGMAKRAPTPVQAQRDRAEQVGLAGGGGPGPGGVEQRPGRGGVAGAQPQVGLGGEQADQVGVGQPLAGVGDRRSRARVRWPAASANANRAASASAAALRPGHRGRGAGHRDRRRRSGGPARPANTGPPRSCRRSSAAATRWCRSSRRAGASAA